jgi:predicted lipoprotein with Yx(FWY)xxD motif
LEYGFGWFKNGKAFQKVILLEEFGGRTGDGIYGTWE